ncbi:MAG: M48 family metallopeptidase [bacterium]|nr:M48 family metallopeptidase [bacterium]
MKFELFILLVIAARLSAEIILLLVNRAYLKKRASELIGSSDEIAPNRLNYCLEKFSFGGFQMIFDAIILIAFLYSGILPQFFEWFRTLAGSGIWSGSALLIAISMIMGIFSFPWDYYHHFVLEQKYGFNKMGVALWLKDHLKGLLLGVIIGVPLVAGLLWLYENLGDGWWIYASLVMIAFQLLGLFLFPKLILPLFYKLEDLPDGELKQQLGKFMNTCDFEASKMQVMDGSTRSGHSNAFFTGFGRARQVVLFDTLIEQLDSRQLKAVLAHEIGHYRLGHIPRRLIFATISLFGSFYLLNVLSQWPPFFESFGFSAGDPVALFLLVSLLLGEFMFWFSPIGNGLSRKHEFEADAFAKEKTDDPEALVEALQILAEENLSNPYPHKIFNLFYASHPDLHERRNALLKVS